MKILIIESVNKIFHSKEGVKVLEISSNDRR
jgi:hypothetical protein